MKEWFGKDKYYVCHSWLLSLELKHILPKSSNIIPFQNHLDVPLQMDMVY